MSRLGGLLLVAVAVLGLIGVAVRSESSPVGVADVAPASTLIDRVPAAQVPAAAAPAETATGWAGYPTVPYLPVLEEIDGIPIPRAEASASDYVVGGDIPVDVGNPAATGETTPVTGGSLTIRFPNEPKSLNPITESSAVQTYIGSYVFDPLVYRNPETFELEPAIAKRWVTEDSVKLRADFPGRERAVAVPGGQPALTVAVTVPEPPQTADDAEPPTPTPIPLLTTDAAGKPAARTWVGFYPAESKAEVQHLWSDADGKLDAAFLPAGRYTAKVGFELYGVLEDAADGFTLVPKSNPDAKPLSLKAADVVDVQRQTVFTYDLREDVTWSDGKPFTAADLAFAYAVINNPLVDGDSIRVYYADLVECEPLGPHAIRMKYRRQYFQAFQFTYELSTITPPKHLFERLVAATGRTLVMDRLTPAQEQQAQQLSVHGAEFAKFFNTTESYNNSPLGTGPYTLDNTWEKHDRATLTRRKDYWRSERAGYLNRIVVKFISDQTTAMQALKAGEIDFFWVVLAEQFFEELAGPPAWITKNFVMASWFYPAYSYAGWNLRRPQFADRRVRLALTMLIDRPQFLEKKQHGAGVLVSGGQYIFGPVYDQTVLPLDYDPQTALDLLAEAGWIDTDGDGVLDRAGKKFAFQILIPSGASSTQSLSELMQYDLKRVGIQVDVLQLEWSSFLERILSREFDVVVLAWASELESDPFQLWHSSEADPTKRSSNHVGFVNPLADQLIERIRITLDPEERRRLFNTFHRLIDSEQPYTFLWTKKELGIYRQKYRGVKFYPLRPGFDLREWYIPKELQ